MSGDSAGEREPPIDFWHGWVPGAPDFTAGRASINLMHTRPGVKDQEHLLLVSLRPHQHGRGDEGHEDKARNVDVGCGC